MTHFSDELIQDILVDKDNNYFTKIIEDVSKYLDKHKTVLDVGCGNGLFIYNIKKISNCRLYGIDSNKKSLEICNKLGYDETFYCEDFSSSSLFKNNQNKFDLIICKDVFEHLFDPENLLIEIDKNLKDDGLFIFHVPNHFPLEGRIKILFNNKIDTFNYFPKCDPWDFPHIKFFTHESIVNKVKKYNFNILQEYSYLFFKLKFFNKILPQNIKKILSKKFPNLFCESFTFLLKKKI